MSFGLKNAGVTYQRLVNHMSQNQIGHNIEVYVDDILVKSQYAHSHLGDLAETFNTLNHYQIKLNPTKCAFKFLGFLVLHRGIEANPEKIQAVIQLKVPTIKQEMQRLIGKTTTLGRFIARSTNKCLSFFKSFAVTLNGL